jgi:hypothetical protein
MQEAKKKGKKKKWNRKMEQRGPQTVQRRRSWSLTATSATLPNEQAVAALPYTQHILDANRLTWPDVGHHPDCQFASFIHASQQQEPTRDPIIDTRRKCRSWLRLNPPDAFVPEAWTKRCNEYATFNPRQVVMNTPYAVLQAYINAARISMPHECHCSFVKSSSQKDNPPPEQEQSSSDNFADIPHVQCDDLSQSGALKLVHQLYLSGDAANCGKRVLFGISLGNYVGIYQNAMCSLLL